MKFALSTLITLFVATTTVSAKCYRRRSTIPSGIERREIDPMVSVPEEVLVRRYKGGRRLDRRGPPARAQGNGRQQDQERLGQSPNGSSKSNSGVSDSQQASTSSMTSAQDSQPTASKVPQGWSSSGSAASHGGVPATKSSSSTAAQATSTGSSSSSSSSDSYSGEATLYYQNGVAGACGSVASDSDKVVALQTSMYGSGDYCGKSITITNTDTGASTTATVADECPSCSSSTSIDLSTGAFDAIGSEDTGVLNVSWSFN